MYRVIIAVFLIYCLSFSVNAKSQNEEGNIIDKVFANLGLTPTPETDFSLKKSHKNHDVDVYFLSIKGQAQQLSGGLLCKRIDYNFKIESRGNIANNTFHIINQYYYLNERIKQQGVSQYAVLRAASHPCNKAQTWIYYNSFSHNHDHFITLYNWAQDYLQSIQNNLTLTTIYETK